MSHTLVQQDHELEFILQVLQHDSSHMIPKFSASMDWDRLSKLIIRHRVWHQVCTVIKPLQHEVPLDFFERLSQLCQKDTLKMLTLASENVRVASSFSSHAIFHCFFKGIALNTQLYGSLTSRPCKDIDVWVAPEDIPQASALLESLGYQQTVPNYALSGFQKKYYFRNNHDIAFYNTKHKIEVELHFKLAKPGLNFFLPTEAITKNIKLFNTSLTTLNDDYHLLYLMLHGARHAFNRLRWLQDIVLYIKSGTCSLDNVFQLAKTIKCEHIVEQSLLLVQMNFGESDPQLSLLIHNPSKKAMKLAHAAQEFILSDYEYTGQGSINNKLYFKYQIYLIQLAPFHRKFLVGFKHIFKIDKLFPYVRFPDTCYFMYYLLYPFWVIKMFLFR